MFSCSMLSQMCDKARTPFNYSVYMHCDKSQPKPKQLGRIVKFATIDDMFQSHIWLCLTKPIIRKQITQIVH